MKHEHQFIYIGSLARGGNKHVSPLIAKLLTPIDIHHGSSHSLVIKLPQYTGSGDYPNLKTRQISYTNCKHQVEDNG